MNARCTQCADIFRVEKPAPEPAPLPELTPEPAVPQAVEPTPPPPPVETPAPSPTVESSAPAAPEPERVPPPTPPVASPAGGDPFAQAAPFEGGAPEPEAAAAPVQADAPVQGFTFGKRDPTDKAKRLARVLVSDMIMYNAERHQSALAAGTLAQDFEEEIEKSWKEYVEQVGEEMANGPGRQFWTEALNDILAKGNQVF